MEDQLFVRTMKDDLAQMNATPEAVAVVPAAPVPVLPKPKREKAQPPVFSLPSKEAPLRKRNTVVIGIAYILLFFVLIAGGVYGYMRWSSLQVPGASVEGDSTLSQVIPKEALAVVDYNFETEGNRTAVRQMWSERTDGSESDIASGNPVGLLGLSDLTHMTYVLMPENQTPFVVLKKTKSTAEFFSQQRGIQIFETGGWYVVHTSNTEQYKQALLNGSITDTSSLIMPSDNSSYVVRYAMSPAFISQHFHAIATSSLAISGSDTLAFTIVAPTNDGAIHASAHIPQGPIAEGVAADTSELIKLIPGDLNFVHVGLSFADELHALEEKSYPLDASVLAQPAVRQFLSLFTTAYAAFERKGSDGITDIGLILSLPSSLQGKMKTGEPVVEQALPALIPLILGKALGVQVAFNDAAYNGVPLRYVNINGQTQTLDYAVGDNFLLISSSREGINALIDTSLSGKQELSLEEPWKSLGEKSAGFIGHTAFSMGSIEYTVLQTLLPIADTTKQVPVMVSSTRSSTGTDIQIVLVSR